jgi:hypothetical protein
MAKDLFHNAVKQALIKEQWVITADPLIIKIEGVKLEIDLAAERVFAAEKAGQKIKKFSQSLYNYRFSCCLRPISKLSSSTLNSRTRKETIFSRADRYI